MTKIIHIILLAIIVLLQGRYIERKTTQKQCIQISILLQGCYRITTIKEPYLWIIVQGMLFACICFFLTTVQGMFSTFYDLYSNATQSFVTYRIMLPIFLQTKRCCPCFFKLKRRIMLPIFQLCLCKIQCRTMLHMYLYTAMLPSILWITGIFPQHMLITVQGNITFCFCEL